MRDGTSKGKKYEGIRRKEKGERDKEHWARPGEVKQSKAKNRRRERERN